MRFFNRTVEINKLREIERLSHKNAQFTIVSGRRRIGKTSLVRNAYEGMDMLYFFVARKAETDLCTIFMDEIRTKLDVPVPQSRVDSFASVFRFVMELAKTRHIILFIDEFQDFYRVNPSIFSDMQNIWDECKSEASINLIVAGSVNSLLNRIFKDKKEPLFGRQTDMLRIRPFKPSVLREIMAEYSPGFKNEDLLALYALTGGVAKYVEIFVDRGQLTKTKMLNAIFREDSYFIGEGKSMLVDEFGKDYNIYFSILTLIAQGCNTRSEIEDRLGGIEIAGYLKKLMDDYELIVKHQPLFENSPNKNVHYAIGDNFLRFWFRFVYKYTHIIEAGGMDRLRDIVERDFSTFSGHSLEDWFRECLRETGKYTRIGYWHDRKGFNEIDIVAEDELERRVEMIEVKRQSKNLDLAILRAKSDVMTSTTGTFRNYTILYRGLTLDDM